MFRGGYRIVDFHGHIFTSGVAQAVKGAHWQATNAFLKATMVSGLVVGDTKYPDFYAPFVEGDNSMETTVVVNESTLTIAIADDDMVTVTVS